MNEAKTMLGRAARIVRASLLLPFALLGPAGLKLAASVSSGVKTKARRVGERVQAAVPGRTRK